jgi:multimeric flavodoxin WrbA
MNKAIIILGSSRSDGNTKKAVESLNPDNSMSVIDLNEIKISPYDYENKNEDDDYLGLMEKILEYDAIILASPVYWYSMSAIMKIFIDRLSDCLTIRKDIGYKLKGKYVYVLASSPRSLPECFIEPFRATCEYMKMNYAGEFLYYPGDDVQFLSQNKKISEFRKDIEQLNARIEKYKL